MHAAQTDKDINTRVWNTQHAADRLCVVVQDKNCYGSADARLLLQGSLRRSCLSLDLIKQQWKEQQWNRAPLFFCIELNLLQTYSRVSPEPIQGSLSFPLKMDRKGCPHTLKLIYLCLPLKMNGIYTLLWCVRQTSEVTGEYHSNLLD